MALALFETCSSDARVTEGVIVVADMELVSRMIDGDTRAWTRFLARHDADIRGAIARVRRRFLSSLTTDDAEEIRARVLAQLLGDRCRRLRSFDAERGRLGAWIARLATNAAYDHLRRARLERRLFARGDLDALPSLRVDAGETYDAHERAAESASLIARLSPRERELVSLYFDEGLDPEQVAARMGTSVSTVYSRKNKVQTKLRRFVHDAVARHP